MAWSISNSLRLGEDLAGTDVSVLPKRATNQMDEAAFQAFYSATAPKFSGYIRRAAKDSTLAEDIVQDAFLKFLRTCPAGLEERQQRAYLYRTGISLLTDHWRRARRERLWTLFTRFREVSPHAESQHALTAESGDMGAEMRQIFSRLKPQEQALLWMA